MDSDSPVGKELNRLLQMIISHYNSLVTLLELSHFGQILQRLDFTGRKSIALHLANNALESETPLSTQEQVSISNLNPSNQPRNDDSTSKMSANESYSSLVNQ